MISLKKIYLLVFCVSTQLLAQSPKENIIILDDTFTSKNLLGSIVYIEDKNKILSIEEINSSVTKHYSDWSTTGEKQLSFGFTSSAYWIFFKIQNKSTSLEKIFLEINLATMDKIEIFYPNQNGKFTKKIAGDMYSFKDREVKFRTIVFSIPTNTELENPIFLRLENKGPMKFSLTLRSPDEFSAYVSRDHVILGIYYGIMIVIFLYNLFLFFSITDNSYLFYILYVLHIAIYQFIISGNAAQFLFSDSPDIANRAPNVFANLTFITALLFTKNFLRTNEYAIRWNLILNGMIIALVIYVSIILIAGHEMILMKMSNLLGLVNIVIIIASATQVYRKGYRPARFFLFGWSFLLLSVFIQIMANLGTFNLTAEHIGQIGSAIEVILLSFALADRMKIQKTESISINLSPINPNSIEDREETIKSIPKDFVRRPIFTILQKEYNLTYQQAQVCSALMDGKSRTIIAKELDISANTLKKHLSEIYSKTINKIENRDVPAQEKLQKLTIFLHNLKPKD
jgi:DNA-binding CsgD family transcriptional regulator